MPIVQITIVEGRPVEQKVQLLAAVTDAVETSLKAPRETIRVVVHEIPPYLWGIGGKPKGPPPET